MSDDDRLLRALGAIAREEGDRDRSAWERAAAGDDPAAAAPRAGDDDLSAAEAAALADLLRPTSPADEAALIERALASLSQKTGNTGQVPEVREIPGAGDPPPAIDLARARARRRWLGLGGGALAAAAALALWLRGGRPGGALELPEYGFVARNQTVQSARGEPVEGPARYRAESEIDWVLAPEGPITAATGVVILVEGTGVPRLVRPPVERSEEGALRIRGEVGERLGLAAGRYTLRFLIGPAAALPGDAAAVDGALARGRVREAAPRYEVEILE